MREILSCFGILFGWSEEKFSTEKTKGEEKKKNKN